jgi:hypothetical protein
VVSLLEQGRQRAVCEGLDHRGDDPEELSTGYPRAHAPHTAALVSPHSRRRASTLRLWVNTGDIGDAFGQAI